MRNFHTLSLLVFGLSALTAASTAQAVPLTGGTGPGGVDRTNVSTDLRLWLAANDINLPDGTNITTWNNRVTVVAGSNATVANTAPTFENGVGDLRNGNPVLDFSGRDGASTTVGDVMIGTLSTAIDKTFFIVARPEEVDGACCNGGIVTSSLPNGLSTQGASWMTDFGGAGPAGGSPNILNTWTFAVGTYANDVVTPANAAAITYINGSTGLNNAGGVNRGVVGTDYRLGSRIDSIGNNFGRFFDGQIAEVGIFNGVATFVERKLIENYMSSKYDIAMLVGDVYSGDTVGAGNYDYDVFGIGSDGISPLLNSGSNGFGFEATSVDNGEWMLAGHKGTINAIVDLEGNPNLAGNRWDRVWFLDKTGALDATLGFDFEDSGIMVPGGAATFHLLYSADNDFSDGWNVIDATSLISSGLVTFNLLDADLLDGYYTLGINISLVPEPSTCILLGLGSLALVWRGRRRRK